MKNEWIFVAEQFYDAPWNRFEADGPNSGELFRKKFLEPVLQKGASATIVLDGAVGYSPPFLEEAFGGLIRAGYSKETVKASFKYIANDRGFARFIDRIEEFIEIAAAKAA